MIFDRERIQRGFDGQRFMGLLGAELGSVSEGFCEIILPFHENLTQQHGFFHGGVVATLADNAGAGAGYTMMSPDEQPLSIEFKVSFLSKAVGERLIARARVLKSGRRIKVCQAEIFAESSGNETLCAIALVSVIATEVRPAARP
jgi:uncharacterized protein (TIGR00369 family)